MFTPIYVRFLFIICAGSWQVFSMNGQPARDDVISDKRYKLGKDKLVELERISQTMPKYSECWIDALDFLRTGCTQLTDDMQHRMSLRFANCFLLKIGRAVYPCDEQQELAACTRDMPSDAFNTYLEFFTHTQNMCFFLRSQIWHQKTENTIASLADNSATVAKQLEASSELQEEIMKHQNRSIENQMELLQRGAELRNTLEDSSTNVRLMLQDFHNSTKEQKLMIFEVFDRVNSLQSLVMGEFTGFYSLVFYTLSIIISYLLTSTSRTNGARFWLFFLMTLNIILERLLIWWHTSENVTSGQSIKSSGDIGNLLYRDLWVCRKSCSVLAICIWLWFAYRYRDYNRINNQLLEEIRRQNYDLKQLLQSGTLRKSIDLKNGVNNSVSTIGPLVTPMTGRHNNTTGYESESDDSDTSSSTDHTFLIGDEDLSDASSETSLSSSRLDSTSSLVDELCSLSPVSMQSFIAAVSPVSSPAKVEKKTPRVSYSIRASVSMAPRDVCRRYNLRTRSTVLPTIENVMVHSETAGQFGKVVKKLSKVAIRNSRLTRMKEQRQRNVGVPFFSSDED